MDYQKIKYFLKAAETLNFSEAARQMYITPQAFGRQITALEEDMGFELFERGTRQIQLTDLGKICYENFNGLVNRLDNEYEKMCQLGSKRKKEIRIGVFNALSLKKVVTPIVTSILARFPDQDINISMCDMVELKEQILGKTMDLCITATHETEDWWSNCEIISLRNSPAQVVVSNYHPWVVKKQVTEEELRQYDFLKMDITQNTDQDVFVQFPCKAQRTVSNYSNLCFGLEQGNCFTIMSADIDSYCEKNGKAFPLPCFQFDFNLALIYNRNNTHAFLPELCQFIKEEFEP